MTIIKQISDFTCVLACIESITSDWGCPISQKDLIEQFPDLCNKGKDFEGAFTFNKDNFDRVGKYLGFTWSYVQGLTESGPDVAYLILTTEGDKHCVRIAAQKDLSSFWVMDPSASRYVTQPALFEFSPTNETDRKPILIQINRVDDSRERIKQR